MSNFNMKRVITKKILQDIYLPQWNLTKARYSVKSRQVQKEISACLDTQPKILKVAVIGVPNSGKSTIINNLLDRKVCPVSNKVHTTRNKACAVFTEENSQVLFLDTPGLVNENERKRHKLGESFVTDCEKCLREADSIGVIHDVSNMWTRDKLDIKVVKVLQNHIKIPSFLVLNKIDLLKSKRTLLDLTRILTENCIDGKQMVTRRNQNLNVTFQNRGWPFFKEVFMVSALTGNGTQDIKNYLKRIAKPGEWVYPEEVWSDQTPEKIIVDSVKAKLLDFLPQEIPYSLNPELELFEINEEGRITTAVTVMCPSERIAKLIAGVGNGRLRQITESLQGDLQNTFQNYVRLKLVLNYKNG